MRPLSRLALTHFDLLIQLRVLLAYLQHFADSDSDGRVTADELTSSLAPFVPVTIWPPFYLLKESVHNMLLSSCLTGNPRGGDPSRS